MPISLARCENSERRRTLRSRLPSAGRYIDPQSRKRWRCGKGRTDRRYCGADGPGGLGGGVRAAPGGGGNETRGPGGGGNETRGPGGGGIDGDDGATSGCCGPAACGEATAASASPLGNVSYHFAGRLAASMMAQGQATKTPQSPTVTTESARFNQNFHESTLYVYAQVQKLRKTASSTAGVLLFGRFGARGICEIAFTEVSYH